MALGSSSVGVPGRGAWGAPVPLAGDCTAQAPLAAEGQKRLLARESSDLLSEETNCA